LVSGQWQKQGNKLNLVVVENSLAPNIPKQAELQAIKYA
jgi:hypothetical protein